MILDYISNANVLPFEQQVSQNFSSELQWSPNLIIAIVLDGELSIHYKNHSRDFQEHDIYFFPPFETFSVVHSTIQTRVLTLLVDATYINKLCPDVGSLSMRQNHIRHDLGNETYTSICHDFATIIFNNLKNETCSRLKLLSAINNIITAIFETYGIKDAAILQHEYHTERIIAILQYINEHYSEKLSVNDIAAHLGIHPQYFSAFFGKHFHTTFVEYLTTFRVNRSLAELLYTTDSILDIALNHGFSNHKTYAAAFRKLYHASPMEYRKAHQVSQNTPPESLDVNAPDTLGRFSYFRQFVLSDSRTGTRSSIQKQQVFDLDVTKVQHASPNLSQQRFLSCGRAFACLRSEVQNQIIQAKQDFHFEYLRFRDIFSDDLYIYYENENKEPLYSWQSLDSVFDFILSLGVKPFPEIGYMPERLASKKQFTGWSYHANVSAPKSIDKWKDLIRNFLIHILDRYGAAEVHTWYFDFWTSPDLKIKNAYWNESMDDFFTFYKVTYDVFHEVDPDLLLGTPNFSTISGFPWYEAFFQYCYANHIYPSYVSIHVYGCELMKTPVLSESFSDIDAESFSISNQNFISEQLLVLHQIMNRCGFRTLDVIVSDWNLSFLPKDLIRDTCYMGPYICHTYSQTLPQVKGMCYWTLSDIHEDAFPESTLFSGGPGLMDYHGLKKASYNTVSLISRLGNEILQKGDNYLFVRKGQTYQLLIYNLAKFDYMYSLIDKSVMDSEHRYNIYGNTENLFFNLMIKVPSGTYYVKKYEVNRKHGSAYDIWGQMGYPAVLSKDMEDYIRDSSKPLVSFTVQKAEDALIIDESIPAHGVLLLEITPK